MSKIKKILCVSTQTKRRIIEDVEVLQVKWKDLQTIGNLADYDHLLLNFTAFNDAFNSTEYELDPKQASLIFERDTWYHVLKSGGGIVCIGEVPTDRWLNKIFKIVYDTRGLDYGRVDCKPDQRFAKIKKYLDAVSDWKRSITNCHIQSDWHQILSGNHCSFTCNTYGQTKFGTSLAIYFDFHIRYSDIKGALIILPSMGNGADAEDDFVLREFFGVKTSQPEPSWVGALRIPGEQNRQDELDKKRVELEMVSQDIAKRESEITVERRWYRLLYDDGHSLEKIVKEAVEFIGGIIEQPSKEIEDWRLVVSGQLPGVIEIKGTHKSVFGAPALRSLAHWMDLAIERNGQDVKGIFIGNSNRSAEPKKRENLFEKSSANLADVRKIVIIRTLDLLCLVVLQMLGKLDQTKLWNEIFQCAGQFNAKKYHDDLLPDFKIIRSTDDAQPAKAEA